MISEKNSATAGGREVFSVSSLNRRCRQLLETHLPLVWVEGEISNLSQPTSGHWYFTLKDDQAQVKCAMFRNRNQLVRFRPQQGQQVLLRARVSIYEGRGDFQLIAEHLEEAGLGALQRAFDQLKAKLGNEGLFDSIRKKELVKHPSHIAIITSPTGAAIRDILSVCKRRNPGVALTVLPVPVQGNQAAPSIIKALILAEASGLFDSVILARGGGSLEDLWAFNEENLARAIADCSLPVISAIGHETDFTIADFVADLRAPTPSAAAELAVPAAQDLLAVLGDRERQLTRAINSVIERLTQKLQGLSQQLRHPGEKLQMQSQQLDFLEARLEASIMQCLQHQRHRWQGLCSRLQQNNPKYQLDSYKQHLNSLQHQLQVDMKHYLHLRNQHLQQQARLLDGVSPLATLGRGFAALSSADGTMIKSVEQVKTGQQLHARLSDGAINCSVLSKAE